MRRLKLTPLAQRDVEEIYRYIADDSARNAKRVITELRDVLYKLAKSPGIGHWREDLAGRAYRFLPFYSYLIVYKPDTKPLEVVRVLHAGRDVRRLLDIAPDPS